MSLFDRSGAESRRMADD